MNPTGKRQNRNSRDFITYTWFNSSGSDYQLWQKKLDNDFQTKPQAWHLVITSYLRRKKRYEALNLIKKQSKYDINILPKTIQELTKFHAIFGDEKETLRISEFSKQRYPILSHCIESRMKTRLVKHDLDGIISEYETLSKDEAQEYNLNISAFLSNSLVDQGDTEAIDVLLNDKNSSIDRKTALLGMFRSLAITTKDPNEILDLLSYLKLYQKDAFNSIKESIKDRNQILESMIHAYNSSSKSWPQSEIINEQEYYYMITKVSKELTNSAASHPDNCNKESFETQLFQTRLQAIINVLANDHKTAHKKISEIFTAGAMGFLSIEILFENFIGLLKLPKMAKDLINILVVEKRGLPKSILCKDPITRITLIIECIILEYNKKMYFKYILNVYSTGICLKQKNNVDLNIMYDKNDSYSKNKVEKNLSTHHSMSYFLGKTYSSCIFKSHKCGENPILVVIQHYRLKQKSCLSRTSDVNHFGSKHNSSTTALLLNYSDNTLNKSYENSNSWDDHESNQAHLIDGIPQSISDIVSYNIVVREPNLTLEKCIRLQLIAVDSIKINWMNNPDIDLLDQTFVQSQNKFSKKDNNEDAKIFDNNPITKTSDKVDLENYDANQNTQIKPKQLLKYDTFGKRYVNFIQSKSCMTKGLQKNYIYSHFIDLTLLLVTHGLVLPDKDINTIFLVIASTCNPSIINKIAWSFMHYNSIWTYKYNKEDLIGLYINIVKIYQNNGKSQILSKRLHSFIRQIEMNF